MTQSKWHKKLSIIIPTYNEENMIAIISSKIKTLMTKENIEYNIFFVDDGSKDNTWINIEKQSKIDNTVKGIRFSRNFGKEAAIFAGLENCDGACCVVIDCDMQHPPEKIIEMYRLWENGYEVIEGIKKSRGKESKIHKFLANIFYTTISKALNIDLKGASDFKLLDRKVINSMLTLKEKNTFFRALSSWTGFKKTSINFEVKERLYGKTKWSLSSLFKYAISNITSFTALPMQLVTILGMIMLVISIIFAFISLYQKFGGKALQGFTTVIILLLFIGSIIMISLGIIGYYISKIYDEVKARPRFIITDNCGEDFKNAENNTR